MFSEQIKLFGVEGQKRIERSSCLVVGAGGVGSSALTYLKRAGIGKITIVDPDQVELSNLARQILYSEEDIGKSKAKVAQEKLNLSNSYQEFFTKEHLQSCDIVLDCTDNASARYAINDACQEKGIPWVFAAIHLWEAQVALFYEGLNYRSLFPEEPKEELNCSSGVIGAFVGMIGACQALEALKYLIGIQNHKLVTFNVLDWSVKSYHMNQPKSVNINYETYQQMNDAILIDIREPEERQNGHIGGLHIPMNQLEENLPKSSRIVLYCQHGHRSQKMAEILQRKFPKKEVYSLEGGFVGALTFKDAAVFYFREKSG